MSDRTHKNEFKVEKLRVKINATRQKAGAQAAKDATAILAQLLDHQAEVSIIFAAAPSQNEFLHELGQVANVDWTRVVALHMDEYIGLPDHAPQAFGNFLRQAIFDKLPFKAVHYLNGNAPNLSDECARYTQILKQHPVDLTCCGIGENAHLAFNDPSEADFAESMYVKVVELDEITRQQQVNDGCFDSFDEVPTHALTLTIPALMQAKHIICVVPSRSKARAVEQILKKQISTEYPASILRTHDAATLYLDHDAASRLDI